MEIRPVVCGVDIGSWTFKVCAYDGKHFEVLTNEANFRETPSLVSFTPSERLIGEEALNKLKSNWQNTVRAPMRLIGLERSFDLVEQELKNATARYEIDEELLFTIKHEKEKGYTVQPQHLLITLLGKVRKIIESHSFQIEHLYIPIPSYLSHYERKIIKRCAQTAGLAKNVRLVDDWVCLATEYSFSRLKQIKTSQARAVVFVDIGYSKMSIFIMQFSQKEVRLLDCEHMRFTGSKHMDHLLAEFYDAVFKQNRHQEVSIFSLSKSYIKLLDNIEKQRTVLSANLDHQLNVESLIDDHDLVYHMKREELQKIVAPVISQIRKGLNSLKSRMPAQFKIHSIELLGGTSRMPFIRQLISSIFDIQPSKTLNQSEAMAHGATTYGSIDSQILPFDYIIQNMNLTDICVCWNNSGNRVFFGQDELQYTKKKLIFAGNSPVPAHNLISFGNEGAIEMYIYYGQNVSTKSIGYLRFQTPNRVKFTLDANKIVAVQLDNSQPDILKLYDKKQSRWEEMRRWQSDLQLHEERVKQVYQLKNQYESKLYQLKSKRAQFSDFMSAEEVFNLTQQLNSIEAWIESEHNRSVGSQEDYLMYQQKLREIVGYLELFEVLETRRRNSDHLLRKSLQLISKISGLIEEGFAVGKRRKLEHLLQWLCESQSRMRETQWEGYYLTDSSLDFAEQEIGRIIAS